MRPLKALIFLLVSLSPSLAANEAEGGVAPSVRVSEDLKGLLPGNRRDIVIEMEPVLGDVLTNPSIASLVGNERQNKVINLIRQRTRLVQAPVLQALESLGLSQRTKAFWVANRIVVKDVDIGVIQALSKVPGPSLLIREPIKVKIFPVVAEKEDEKAGDDDRAYGVPKINSDKVWAAGNKGKGVVVGVIDTGVNYKHEALVSNYRGNYSWHDAFGEHTTPYDGNGHGTHCTGTICGNTKDIGVAPEAKYISCRGLNDEGSGSDATLIECGQFMACPSNFSTSPSSMKEGDINCTGMPDLISNSWGGLVGGMDFYNPVISTWRAENIIPIFALGNSGPLCMTAGSPGDQPNLISVGATDEKDLVASFSSRGPGLLTGKTKPEVSAPGAKVYSAAHDSNDKYRKLSGTSMACPHVAGATALLLSAKKGAKYEEVLDALEKTAFKPKLAFTDGYKVCSFPPGYPNNAYGYGRIDVEAAVKQISGSS